MESLLDLLFDLGVLVRLFHPFDTVVESCPRHTGHLQQACQTKLWPQVLDYLRLLALRSSSRTKPCNFGVHILCAESLYLGQHILLDVLGHLCRPIRASTSFFSPHTVLLSNRFTSMMFPVMITDFELSCFLAMVEMLFKHCIQCSLLELSCISLV